MTNTPNPQPWDRLTHIGGRTIATRRNPDGTITTADLDLQASIDATLTGAELGRITPHNDDDTLAAHRRRQFAVLVAMLTIIEDHAAGMDLELEDLNGLIEAAQHAIEHRDDPGVGWLLITWSPTDREWAAAPFVNPLHPADAQTVLDKLRPGIIVDLAHVHMQALDRVGAVA